MGHGSRANNPGGPFYSFLTTKISDYDFAWLPMKGKLLLNVYSIFFSHAFSCLGQKKNVLVHPQGEEHFKFT